MTAPFNINMKAVTRLTKAGRLSEATALLRRVLSGAAGQKSSSDLNNSDLNNSANPAVGSDAPPVIDSPVINLPVIDLAPPSAAGWRSGLRRDDGTCASHTSASRACDARSFAFLPGSGWQGGRVAYGIAGRRWRRAGFFASECAF